ncbi:MAG: hypothetical protein V1817_04340 [Candidatus Micrarchaeota archaeon]
MRSRRCGSGCSNENQGSIEFDDETRVVEEGESEVAEGVALFLLCKGKAVLA